MTSEQITLSVADEVMNASTKRGKGGEILILMHVGPNGDDWQPFCPLDDPRDTMRVVERMGELGYRFDCSRSQVDVNDPESDWSWSVEFRTGAHLADWDERASCFAGAADTFGQAVCEAVLSAVRGG